MHEHVTIHRSKALLMSKWNFSYSTYLLFADFFSPMFFQNIFSVVGFFWGGGATPVFFLFFVDKWAVTVQVNRNIHERCLTLCFLHYYAAWSKHQSDGVTQLWYRPTLPLIEYASLATHPREDASPMSSMPPQHLCVWLRPWIYIQARLDSERGEAWTEVIFHHRASSSILLAISRPLPIFTFPLLLPAMLGHFKSKEGKVGQRQSCTNKAPLPHCSTVLQEKIHRGLNTAATL